MNLDRNIYGILEILYIPFEQLTLFNKIYLIV